MDARQVNKLLNLLKYKECPVVVYIDCLNGRRMRKKYSSLNKLIADRNEDEYMNTVIDEAVAMKSLLDASVFVSINMHEE